MLLLQGKGCVWHRCTFCDYYQDTGPHPEAENAKVLSMVTGQYGILDIINSGSAMELDDHTLQRIESVCRDKHIHTLWFEAHYLYHNRLAAFASRFAPTKVKFRCGIESFQPHLRQIWNKGISSDVTPETVARYFDGVCLLLCTQNHTREDICADIATARQYFEYASLNLFCNNSTPVRRNESLVNWFCKELLPAIKDDPRLEILLNNTDLGVG